MKKKILSVLLAMAMIGVTGCAGPREDGGNDAMLNIGILQLMEHGSLDDAREGFVQALADNGYVEGQNIKIDYQNAQGDPNNLNTMSQRLAGNQSDLVLAIGTGAAQSMASVTEEIPILFTAVTDPVDSGLVNTNEAPGTNLSGTNDMSPIKEQIELLVQLCPDIKTIGILYCSGEDNSILQAQQVKEVLEEMSLNWTEATVTNTNDVQQVTQSVAGKCDAIYIPTDNAYASAMGIVAEIAQENKLPVVCGAIEMVRDGGFATLGLNYYNLGYQTGEMAVRVLEGEDISQMPVESLVKYDYYISGEMAQVLGVEVPQELSEYVE